MKIFRTTATFEGVGAFPLDMLRYDSCWPATSEDAAKGQETIGGGLAGRRRITVAKASLTNRREAVAHFAIVRWGSFGWRYVEDSVQTRPA